jgi:hypothetical protein
LTRCFRVVFEVIFWLLQCRGFLRGAACAWLCSGAESLIGK